MWCKLPFSDKCAASECFAYTCRASEPPTRVPADLDTHIRKFKPRAMGSPRRRCCTADEHKRSYDLASPLPPTTYVFAT